MNQRRVYIIAEAGVNHNGSPEMARRLVDVAAESGADAVKFQTFRSATLVSSRAPKAEYQKASTGVKESQLEMLKKLELDEATHHELSHYCGSRGIQFLSTPFDEDSVGLLADQLQVPILKIASGEITNGPLLLRVARGRKPIILSTGMSTLADVRVALGVLAFGLSVRDANPSLAGFRDAFRSSRGQRALKSHVTLLHCTTEYPAAFSEVNLRAMGTLATEFGLPVGLSDHTPGVAVSVAAVGLGACVIEKHFTLDRDLPGPDHQASLLPEELALLVKSVREVEAALGSPRKGPTGSELKNMRIARRSLVALEAVPRGERFTPRNLGSRRPGDGRSPLDYWKLLGRKADRDYEKDEVLPP